MRASIRVDLVNVWKMLYSVNRINETVFWAKQTVAYSISFNSWSVSEWVLSPMSLLISFSAYNNTSHCISGDVKDNVPVLFWKTSPRPGFNMVLNKYFKPKIKWSKTLNDIRDPWVRFIKVCYGYIVSLKNHWKFFYKSLKKIYKKKKEKERKQKKSIPPFKNIFFESQWILLFKHVTKFLVWEKITFINIDGHKPLYGKRDR